MNNKNKIIGSLALATLMVAAAGALTVKDTEYANAEANANQFQMLEGASIRLAEDKNGLRFKTEIGANVYSAIMNRDAGKDVRVGAFIVPAAYVDNQNAYQDGASVGDYDKFKQYKEVCFFDSTNDEIQNKIYQDGDYYYTNAVLTNVKYENLGKEFVGIGYMAWTTSAGTTYEFVDLDATDVVRSAAYVASAHYNNETDSTKLEYVKQYAYGALFEKTGVVTYDETNKQYTVYGADTYTKIDDVMTAIGGQLALVVDKAEVEADVNATVEVSPAMQLTYNTEKGGATTNTVGGVKFAIDCVSSAENVKIEADGTVKAVTGGEATLTFSCMGKTATCDVTVIQRQKSTLALVDLDLSKDSAATITLDADEVASKVFLGETDITSYMTATAGTVSIAKEAFANAPKGDNQLTILSSHYEYDAYVCKADFVISDEAELKVFRAAAAAASDQNGAASLTWSNTWDWYVVLDTDITCTGVYAEYVSYFGVFDGRGHSISDFTAGQGNNYNYARYGFFDNRIVGGDVGVTDSNGVMHEGIGLRVKNLALINLTEYGSGNRTGFVAWTTKGSKFSNIYLSGTMGLVSQWGYNSKNGSFENIVVYTTSYLYFPSAGNAAASNIEGASRILFYSPNPQLPAGYGNTGYTNMTAFYEGVKTAITGSDSWNKHVWGVDANGNITFGDTVVIAKPAA